MTNFLRTVQEGAEHAAEAESHSGGGELDLGELITHHLVDLPEWELPGFTLHLPHWDPVHLGPLILDLSPTKHVLLMLLSALLCIVVFVGIARVMRRKYTKQAPGGFVNAMEAMILYFRDEVVRRNIGHGADAFTPLILTLFFFILTMNLLGLVPFGGSATGDLSVTAALAFVSFVVIEISGFRELGPKGYARTIFYAPKGMHPAGQAVMLVIMTPVEVMSKLTKPFALAIRLFANMTAGHALTLSLLGLILMFQSFTIALGPVLMAVAIMCLEVFVAFLQAYIFAMLTAVFIGLIRHAH